MLKTEKWGRVGASQPRRLGALFGIYIFDLAESKTKSSVLGGCLLCTPGKATHEAASPSCWSVERS